LTAPHDFFVFYLMSAKLSRPMLLSPDDFRSVVRLAPLVSIDLIIRNVRGEVLLGLRNNEPAKGSYFVPGGIILKQERLYEAFARNPQARDQLRRVA
jgi:colanic acid biosynthesis protein WcaH